jgi:hypothetical protein
MVDPSEALDLAPVEEVIAEVKPQLPPMPAEFWHDVELLLFAWHRNQSWRMVDLSRGSVARYARLLASFHPARRARRGSGERSIEPRHD